MKPVAIFAAAFLLILSPAHAQKSSDHAKLAEAWSTFADEIRALGPWLMEQKGLPLDDPQVASTAYRYLATLLYIGLDMHLLNADPDRPEWSVSFAPHAPYGGDHRDGVYHGTIVDPKGIYRVTGKSRGGIPTFANIQTQDGWWQPGRGNKTLETLDVVEQEWEPDGSFELIIGGPERDSNWVALSPEASHMMFRQYISDDRREQLYDITIKRIDQPAPEVVAADTPEELSKKLQNAAGFVRHLAEAFVPTSQASFQQVNKLITLSPEERAARGASEANACWIGSWDLGPEEALVLELTPVEAQYWSVKGHNAWFQALPQTKTPMQVNMLEAAYDSDGKVRFVVSEKDPGYANWISTGGLRLGILVMRMNNKVGEESVTSQVVKMSELAKVMPDDSPRVTPKERAAAMDIKRRQILSRYGR